MDTNRNFISNGVNADKYVAMVVIVITLVAGLLFYINIKNQDINFSQRVFAGLIKGRHSVQKLIDWASFQAVGVDVGHIYSSLANEKERANYKNAFIDKFSLGFRRAGGSLQPFINWRLYAHQGALSIVAADYKGKDKTILFTISDDGRKKLAAIQWEDRD